MLILDTLLIKGGGISDPNLKKIFTYGYTSAHETCDATEVYCLNNFVRSDVAGFGTQITNMMVSMFRIFVGFGLPLARTFSQFFKGDLQLHVGLSDIL
jgi:hypothetical protein